VCFLQFIKIAIKSLAAKFKFNPVPIHSRAYLPKLFDGFVVVAFNVKLTEP